MGMLNKLPEMGKLRIWAASAPILIEQRTVEADLDEAEFDRYADTYDQQYRESIAIAGEEPDHFAEYKIVDLRRICNAAGLEPRSILDFGAGIGASTPFLSKCFSGSDIVSADVSSKSLGILESRYPGLSRPVLIEEDRLPLDDASLDVAFAACVFHHINAAEHHHWLAEIRRILRPGGVFALFEHNPWNPLTVRVVNACPFDKSAVLINAPEMARRLKAAGWQDLATRYRIFFPRPSAPLRPAERLLGWLPLGGQYSLTARA